MWPASRSVACSHLSRRMFNVQGCLASLLSSVQLWDSNPDGVRSRIRDLQMLQWRNRKCERNAGWDNRLTRSIWFFSKLWDAPKAHMSAESRAAHGLNWIDKYG